VDGSLPKAMVEDVYTQNCMVLSGKNHVNGPLAK